MMKQKIKHYILIGALALILALGGWLMATVFVKHQSDEMLLEIRPGDSAATIGAKLQAAGVIPNGRYFALLARITGDDRDLKTGAYKFGGKVNLLETVHMLRAGNSEAISITFPEGWSMYRTLKRIDRSGLVSFDSLMAVATDPVVVKTLTGLDLPSLEGFLYPETYRFELGMSPYQILEIQTKEFFTRLAKAGIDAKADSSFYDKVKLASIVESESMYEDERATVAGVYMNRLAKGMKLEACPTVDYFLEKQGIKREVLLISDVNTPNPYNTYLNLGLPPTPICNPSISSIVAVYNPERHNYLFFQADRQGRNVFSVTYREHLRKMKNLPSRVQRED